QKRRWYLHSLDNSKRIWRNSRYKQANTLKSSFKILLKDENRGNYYKNNENYQKILKTLSKYK
ncbi:hypothetical protein, partial [Cetobacterium sp. 2G large]|uniref:hypothetical protein n=1 Tax=Cetobacterium sp. 2G large TaxID=2759680 RepID=UPI001C8E22F5